MPVFGRGTAFFGGTAMTFEDLYGKWLNVRFFLYRFFLGRVLIYTLRTLPLGIPALVLFILYRKGVTPLWPVWVALGAWAAIVLVMLLFVRIMFRLGRSAGNEPNDRVNRNPYSANKDDFKLNR